MNNFSEMNKFWLLGIGVLLFTHCSPTIQAPRRDSPPARWEGIFFKSIDVATRISKIPPLRETGLKTEDFEARIWRGFGLGPLEGLILRRAGGKWSANHVVSDDCCQLTKTTVTDLGAPKSGWESFWSRMVEMEILSLPDRSDEECISGIDGNGFVVEINDDGFYRTYMYQSGLATCKGSLQMDMIGETIGEEFYDGSGKCLAAEWFPCSEILKNRRLEKDRESK